MQKEAKLFILGFDFTVACRFSKPKTLEQSTLLLVQPAWLESSLLVVRAHITSLGDGCAQWAHSRFMAQPSSGSPSPS
ncbi:Uncharacterized protein TCM_016349 [Theobroma cacao]|uniref:Uncharacterized protein n=1 Tax=Theobroma cacao TaxID=3641 RepID=A0A061G5K9_THECC|nr:Uncharacterized protein TCM_016349 [Theobroma cacao]